jgi:hypothetical protein
MDKHLDHADFWPIFEMAAHLRIPLFIHPQTPPRAVRDAYYSGFGPEVDLAMEIGNASRAAFVDRDNELCVVIRVVRIPRSGPMPECKNHHSRGIDAIDDTIGLVKDLPNRRHPDLGYNATAPSHTIKFGHAR